VICVERWITAPMVMPDGTMAERRVGTPQGGVISPVLANLFLHVVFDLWMGREHPGTPFERYADDAICHCRTRRQAERLVAGLRSRFRDCGLELHPVKTRIVCCRDSNRKGRGLGPDRFEFLGFEFRARPVKGPRGVFDGFTPAVSPANLARMAAQVKAWRIPRLTTWSWEDLARLVNPVVRGWIGYYARYTPQALHKVWAYLNSRLMAWMRRKRGLRSAKQGLRRWRVPARVMPGLFPHWRHTTHCYS
jgi:hypothetical protein